MVYIPAGKTEVELRVPGRKGHETITFIFPPISNAEFAKNIKTLLGTRFEMRGKSRKLVDNQTPARLAFFDATAVDVVGLFMDEAEKVPLNAATSKTELKKTYEVDNWKDVISPPWKTKVAEYFEENLLETEADIESE